VRKDPTQRVTCVIRDYMQKKSVVKRKKLLSSHSDRFKVVDINSALRELKELGLIGIRNNGKTQVFISSSGEEVYEWLGESDG
jgi:predicted transcriptional regulator